MTAIELASCAAGGAAGAGIRAALAAAFDGGKFPWGTFAANFSATVMMASYVFLGLDSAIESHLFSAGFCAALSTFSTFAAQILRMIEKSEYLPAAAYAALSLCFCISAALAFGLA